MNGPEVLQDFIQYAKNNNDYILKILGSSIARYPNWISQKIYDGSSYIITTKRTIIIDQIVSHYIATIRDTWFYEEANIEKYNLYKDQPIKIDVDLIDQCIKYVKYDIDIVSNIKADVSMVYEKFLPHLDTLALKTPQPWNYKELKEIVTERYK